MKHIIPILAFMVLWVLGCFVFDYWLELKGEWLMLGGMITFIVCDLTEGTIRSWYKARERRRELA